MLKSLKSLLTSICKKIAQKLNMAEIDKNMQIIEKIKDKDEKEIKTVKEYIELKENLKKIAKYGNISFVQLTDIRDYNTNELIAIRVEYPPCNRFLITCEKVIEMVQNRELEHIWKTITRAVFEKIKEIFEMIPKKLNVKYEMYRTETGAVIYKTDGHRSLKVGSIDICLEVMEKTIENEISIKIRRVKFASFIIKIESKDYDDIKNLTDFENLINEYLRFGEFRSLESD